jgi:hypothetical protein
VVANCGAAGGGGGGVSGPGVTAVVLHLNKADKLGSSGTQLCEH